eukprot:CAMPEP_0196585262 /NCGR_PEP_ID=MMETSP1081-20130531/50055_1 /TAXON_ID=36882 /ORGANISM="Pyramimonas amylifera, Strain CCMP720" /LENGTH=337 /DNA_ID=CAMNT_0041906751 /DNA_START=417 /DNA_END=1430 /DNA_ORIENTATION=+
MLAFIPLGSSLERTVGTAKYSYTILLFCVLSALLHSGLGWLMAVNPVYPVPQEMYRCSMGFSGIIFGLIAMDTHDSNIRERSIFGFFTVPSKYYPWALLGLFQLLMPNVSFLGHLSGLLIGLLYAQGRLQWLLLSSRTLAFMEAKCFGWFPHLGEMNSTFVKMHNELGGLDHFLPWAALPPPAHSEGFLSGVGKWVSGPVSAFSGRGHTLGGGDRAASLAPAAATSSSASIPTGPTFAQMPGSSGSVAPRAGPPPLRGSSSSFGPGSITLGGAPSAPPIAQPVRSYPEPSLSKGKLPMIISDQSVQQLVDMGFEEATACKALEAANGDITMAIEILT